MRSGDGAASPLCGFTACVFPVLPSSLVNMVTTDVIGTRNNCNRRSFVLAFLSWNYDYGGQESHECPFLHKLVFIWSSRVACSRLSLLRTLSWCAILAANLPIFASIPQPFFVIVTTINHPLDAICLVGFGWNTSSSSLSTWYLRIWIVMINEKVIKL